MEEITFIGNLSATFASRWRRELASDQVKVGKQLSKELAQNRTKFNEINDSSRNSALRKGRVKNQDKFIKTQEKIGQISNSAKTQKASLLSSNKADPLIEKK